MSLQVEMPPESGLEPRASWESILAKCREGDGGARQQLYDLCQGKIYRLMVRMVGRQDAADLTQQVFLQMFSKIDQFAGQARFETWLYRLAVNEALQYRRRSRRWKFQTLTREPTSRPDPNVSSEENKELIDRALLRLEPQLRSLFLLHEVEGLSYCQSAATCGIPPGTVGSRLNRARRKLQQELKHIGWEP